MMDKLKIPAFTADFRAYQQPRGAFLIGKISRGPVAFDNGHALMKNRRGDTGAVFQGLFQVNGGLRLLADQQCFLSRPVV